MNLNGLFMGAPFVLLFGGYIFKTLVIFLIAFIAFKLRNRIVKKLLQPTKFSEAKKLTLEQVFTKVLGIVILGTCVIQILLMTGVEPTTLTAVLGTLTVAFGLAAKDLVQDFLTGAILIFEDAFHVGDVITVNDYTGTVVEINMRTLELRGYDGILHTIPNGTISTLSNHTHDYSCAVVTVGVAYEDDVDKVLEVLNDEMSKAFDLHDSALEIPNVQGITELADSSVNIRIVTKCLPGSQWALERELRRLIKNRFDKENISIPFPQRVVTINKE